MHQGSSGGHREQRAENQSTKSFTQQPRSTAAPGKSGLVPATDVDTESSRHEDPSVSISRDIETVRTVLLPAYASASARNDLDDVQLALTRMTAAHRVQYMLTRAETTLQDAEARQAIPASATAELRSELESLKSQAVHAGVYRTNSPANQSSGSAHGTNATLSPRRLQLGSKPTLLSEPADSSATPSPADRDEPTSGDQDRLHVSPDEAPASPEPTEATTAEPSHTDASSDAGSEIGVPADNGSSSDLGMVATDTATNATEAVTPTTSHADAAEPTTSITQPQEQSSPQSSTTTTTVATPTATPSTKVSPARMRSLLRGQRDGLLKLYKAGKLTYLEVLAKMVNYGAKLNGGEVPPEANAMAAELHFAMHRHRSERTKQPRGQERTSSSPLSHIQPDTSHISPPKDPPKLPASSLSELDDKDLATQIERLGDPRLKTIGEELASLRHFTHQKYKNKRKEESGSARDTLVAGIAHVRSQISSLPSTGAYTSIKSSLYRQVQELSPFYEQYGNVDILEGFEQAKHLGTKTTVSTRTCNITSVAMCLELLGKTTNDYKGDRSKIIAIARYWNEPLKQAYDSTNKGKGGWEEVAGLRLPDFLQLASIAEFLKDTTDEAIEAATKAAWLPITTAPFLEGLPALFGAQGTYNPLSGSASPTSLRQLGADNHRTVKSLRNEKKKQNGAPSDNSDEFDERLKRATNQNDEDIAAYKETVLRKVGPELDAGAGVVVGLHSHYVRLQGFYNKGIVIDDPGSYTYADRKITWTEARAMGYFQSIIVIR